jgi:hypothetical protein
MLRRLLDTVLRRAKPSPASAPSTDYAGNRETERVGHLGPEDRAWETATRQRNQDNQARAEADRAPRP